MSDAVGFIGLGTMGSPMALRLLDWPGGLVVSDVRDDATAPIAEKGATVASTPAEVAAQARVVSLMVLDDAQVRDVVVGADGILAGAEAGTVVAIHSTIRAETAIELAAECAPRGVSVVDAPVSGGFMGAHEGTLAVMVGGDDAAVERCRGPFGHWSTMFVHTGPVGSATRMKLARNLVSFVSYNAASEAQKLAAASGVDLVQLGEVVRHSDRVIGGPGVIMFRGDTEVVRPGDPWYDTLLHTRTLGEKDLSLALELAREVGVELPLTQLAFERYAAGLGVPHDEEE